MNKKKRYTSNIPKNKKSFLENKTNCLLKNNNINGIKKGAKGNIGINKLNKKYIDQFNFLSFFIRNTILTLSSYNFRLIIIYKTIFSMNLYLSHNAMIRQLNFDNHNYIALTIKGTGDKDIIYKNFNSTPNQILINGIPQNYTGKKALGLTRYLNDITIIFNTQISSTKEMFKDLKSIEEIDLSNFDSSIVNDSTSMFSGCSSLASLNLTNFSTDLITNMDNMFFSCYSLSSLNLSGFNTFKVTNMTNMFKSCSKLTSLDLKSFNTSEVTNMQNMFSRCSKLTSLDLKSFNTSEVINMQSMFEY